MKRTRFLAIILALAMILPMAVVQTSAGISIDGKYNYIEIGEEKFIENGDFEEEIDFYGQDIGQDWNKLEAGQWASTIFMSGYYANLSQEAEANGNQYLFVDTNRSASISTAANGVLPAGTYTLSLRLCAETTIPKFIFDIRKVTGATTNEELGPRPSIDVVAAVGDWATYYVNFTLDEDSEVFFRFYPNVSDGTVTKFRIDDVYIGRPTDVLIESANMTVDSTVVDASTAAVPENGKWYASNNTNVSLAGGNAISFKRNPADKVLSDTFCFVYTLPGSYDKGDYRLTIETTDYTTTGTSQGYLGNVADVSGGSWNTNNIVQTTASNKSGNKNTIVHTFTLNSDDAVLAFRMWTDSNKRPFSIDGFKLEALSGVAEYTDDFSDTNWNKYDGHGGGWSGTPFGHWTTINGTVDTDETGRYSNEELGIANVFYYGATDSNPSLVFRCGNLPAGTYTVQFKIKGVSGSTSLNHSVFINNATSASISPTAISDLNDATGNNIDTNWHTKKFSFTVTGSTVPVTFRIYPSAKPYQFYLDDFKLTSDTAGAVLATGWQTVLEDNFDNVKVTSMSYPLYPSGKTAELVGVVFGRDTESLNKPAEGFTLTAKDSSAVIAPSENAINGTHSIKYGFENLLTKGTYSVAVNFKPAHTNKYEIAVVDKDTNEVLSSVTSETLAADTANLITLKFDVKDDTEAVLKVTAHQKKKFASAFEISSCELYKLSDRVTNLNSNGAIAQFDADTGVYYMIAGVQGANGYVNYSNGEEIREGIYQLTGKFKTAASGANLSASIGYYALDEVYAIADDWTTVNFNVVLNNDTTLKPYTGIRFNVDNNANFYFKDLELVFVDDLPKPATKPAIAMIVLKKLQGGMKPQIEKKLYNFMDNADFDEAPVIREKALNYGWTAQKAGEWAISINSADKEGTGSISYGEMKNEKALLVTASKTNPCVSYKLKDKLDAGVYTLSIDVYADGKGTKSFMVDVFDMKSGAAVRIGEGAAIMSRSVKAGEWSTMSVTFTATEGSDVLFRFWSGDASVNYAVDNIQITKPGVFADGTTE